MDVMLELEGKNMRIEISKMSRGEYCLSFYEENFPTTADVHIFFDSLEHIEEFNQTIKKLINEEKKKEVSTWENSHSNTFQLAR